MTSTPVAQGFSGGLIRFIDSLHRHHDFPVSPQEMVDSFRAIESINLFDETEVRITLRTILCSKQAEQEAFDDLFHAFFQSVMTSKESLLSTDGSEQAQGETHPVDSEPKPEGERVTGNGDVGGYAVGTGENGDTETFNGEENRTFLQAVRSSFQESNQLVSVSVPQHDMESITVAAKRLISSVRLKRNRRWKAMSKGGRLDFRKTFRKHLQMGGNVLDPAWFDHPKRKAEFVLFCDCSRSMFPHSERFIQFASAMSRFTQHMELFLFSTRIRRVTRILKEKKRLPVLADLGKEWGGGTRIGESLGRFVRDYGFRLLTKNTVAIIFSDGLDTGDPEILEQAMKAIYLRSNRVIWLNPLAYHPDYEPTAQGMSTAYPYIDQFSGSLDELLFDKKFGMQTVKQRMQHR
jgi:hypothetical protein